MVEQVVGVERAELDIVLSAGDNGVHAGAMAAVSLLMVGLVGFDVVGVVEETVLAVSLGETFLEDGAAEPEAELLLGFLGGGRRSSCAGC